MHRHNPGEHHAPYDDVRAGQLPDRSDALADRGSYTTSVLGRPARITDAPGGGR
ncbi:hypothetical protein ACWEL8_09665 [Streptomyces sp. NPDC004690]